MAAIAEPGGARSAPTTQRLVAGLGRLGLEGAQVGAVLAGDQHERHPARPPSGPPLGAPPRAPAKGRREGRAGCPRAAEAGGPWGRRS